MRPELGEGDPVSATVRRVLVLGALLLFVSACLVVLAPVLGRVDRPKSSTVRTCDSAAPEFPSMMVCDVVTRSL